MSTNDRFRPQYHFTAPKNWMNDPNGLVQWKGQFHLYYQHNPNGAFWGDMHWGHAVSPDLMTWEHLPLAMFPDEDYDRDGVFSGCAVPREDEVLFFYTGVNGETQLPCLATASDDLLTRPSKDERNPLFYPPADLDTVIFRDHSLIQHDDHWLQVIGSGLRDQGGNCMLYRSDDLVTWEFLNPLVSPDDLSEDEKARFVGWECPDFLKIGETYILMVSHWNHGPGPVWWYSGTFDGTRFVPKADGPVDAGHTFYAPQSFTDDLGRRIQFGWMRENRPVDDQIADGWSGCMSLPRELFVKESGALGVKPSNEVLKLVQAGPVFEATSSETWLDVTDADVDTRSCVLNIALRGDADLEILRSADGDEVTTISFNAANNTIAFDSQQSTTNPGIPGEAFTIEVDDMSSVLVFIDRSVIEVFVDGQSHSLRAYPERDDSTGIRFRGGAGSGLTLSRIALSDNH